jgi:tetratricopeptide (TPR) repeat protein
MGSINAELAKFKEEIFLVQSDVKNAYYERAINKLHELVVHHPDKAEPYYELGKMAYNFWRNDEAEANFIKALRANPEYFPTYTQYALVLIKEGRFDEAEALLNRSKTLRNREDADIYFYYGMLFQHKGELRQAIESYKKAINVCVNESQIDLNLKFIRACIELRGWE